jgi:uncharacterized GH25 family protein
MKKALVAMAVVALLAVSVQAGEIKLHNWPCTFVSVEITSIPVVMDVGYWVKIKDQDKLKIKLVQDETDIHKFKGCVDMVVETTSTSFSAAASAPPAPFRATILAALIRPMFLPAAAL